MNAPNPNDGTVIHYIFVDFENVQKIDPEVIGAKNVFVTLLMGPLNTKLDMSVVERLLKHPTSTTLVRLTTSGRNALDFAVAYYVGQTSARNASGRFHIVSKDKDYDPLIKHLRSTNVEISRHDSFDALALSRSPKQKVAAPLAARPKLKSATKAKSAAPGLAELAAKAVVHLQKNPTKLPKTLPKLASHLRTHLGKKITEAEVPRLMEHLKKAGLLEIDEKGAIVYKF
jgi:PIN domain